MEKRRKIGIRALKNETSRVVEEVRERRAEYIVTKRGKPVALLRPLRAEDVGEGRAARVARALERMRRTATVIGELSSGESAVSVVSRQRR